MSEHQILRAAAYRESLTLRPPQPATATPAEPAADQGGVWLLGLPCPHCGSPCLPDPTRDPVVADGRREVYVRCGGCGSVLLVAIRLTTVHRGDGGTAPHHVPDRPHWDRNAPHAGAVAAILAVDRERNGERRAS